MIARCITSCRERSENAAPRSNRDWWPRLEYLDRRRDQGDVVPLFLQADPDGGRSRHKTRSEEHTSELQSLMRISYAVFCLKKKTKTNDISGNIYTYKDITITTVTKNP